MKANKILSFVLALVMTVSTLVAGTTVSAEESLYKDVKTSRWSYEDIKYVTEEGLMTGTGDGIFAPAETMTRAMVVTVLYRLQGSPEVEYKAIFSDVKADKWYTDAVIWAARKEIVNGVGDRKFAPMKAVTREELATIIMRYAPLEFIKTEERADLTVYSDYGKVHDYAKDALSWANAVGLITGVTATTLEPRGNATREQVAAILRRFKEYDSYKYSLAYNEPAGYSTYTEKEYSLVTDADIYVAVDGNDANPGTLDAPIASFARAKEMVREKKATATEEIKVAFKAGNYGALENVTFTAEDSGTESVPITYCAYGDGDVIFTNGLLIPEEDFMPLDDSDKALFGEEVRDNICKVDLAGKFDKFKNTNILFSSTGVCWEARYPNKNPDGTDNCFRDFTTRVEEEGKEEYEYDKLLCQGLLIKILNGFSTYEGMKITGFFRTGWLIDTFAVKSYDRATNILTIDFENSGLNGYPLTEFPLAYEDRMDDTVFFHNLAELMDAKGEYWFDPETKLLYVYAPEGDYAISGGGSFLTVEDGADHISFIGFEFNATSGNGVNIKGDHITINLCTFANIAGEVAVSTSGVHNFTLSECELYNFVSQGVILNSDSSLRLVNPSNDVVENNYFHDFTLPQYFSGTAVRIGNEVGARVSHNVFERGGHSAIVFGGIDNVIEYNVFDRMMMTTQDFGAVYTWESAAYRDNKIRYNLFMHGGCYAIYLDNGTAGQQVYGNIFYEAGSQDIVFNGGRENDVHDNVHINSAWFTWNWGLYSYIEEGNPDGIYSAQDYGYLMGQIVKEGTEGYEIWKDRWPIMYEYSTDPADLGKPNCLFTPIHYVRNEFAVTSQEPVFPDHAKEYGVIENIRWCTKDENPIFTDPTHGDYSIREDADFFKIPFYEIGRY